MSDNKSHGVCQHNYEQHTCIYHNQLRYCAYSAYDLACGGMDGTGELSITALKNGKQITISIEADDACDFAWQLNAEQAQALIDTLQTAIDYTKSKGLQS